MSKEIRFNAFAMNCVGHMAPGLWRHPRDRSDRYIDLSWDRDAVRRDRKSGIFADPAKVHGIEHSGKYFSSRF
jgi:long-chain alkane monooxygenase